MNENDPVNQASIEFLLEELTKAEAQIEILTRERDLLRAQAQQGATKWIQPQTYGGTYGYPLQNATWTAASSGTATVTDVYVYDAATTSKAWVNSTDHQPITMHFEADSYKDEIAKALKRMGDVA